MKGLSVKELLEAKGKRQLAYVQVAREEEAIAAGKPLKIAVEEGKAEWPAAWCLRNSRVTWKTINPSGDIQILDDNPKNRRKLERRRGKA